MCVPPLAVINIIKVVVHGAASAGAVGNRHCSSRSRCNCSRHHSIDISNRIRTATVRYYVQYYIIRISIIDSCSSSNSSRSSSTSSSIVFEYVASPVVKYFSVLVLCTSHNII